MDSKPEDGGTETVKDNTLQERVWMQPQLPKFEEGKEQLGLRVAHWNILAAKLGDLRAFPDVDEQWLDWTHRKKLIMQHIRDLEADVLGIAEFDCLQKSSSVFPEEANELGRAAHSYMLELLTWELEYDYKILEKDNGMSAIAVFYKTAKFQLLDHGHLNLDYVTSQDEPGKAEVVESNEDDGKYNMLYCVLAPQGLNAEEVDASRQFVFAQTHLKAMDDYRFARTVQAAKITKFFQDKFVDMPVILSGDFNDFPQSDPLNEFEKHFIDFYSLKELQTETKKSDEPPCYPDFTLICDTKKAEQGASVEHRCLDYMLINRNKFLNGNQVVVEKFLELPERQFVPPEGQIARLAIPGPNWPSDHYSLAYDVRFFFN